jgi:hypothetical protein
MFVKASLIREGWLWAWWPSKRQADWKVSLGLGIYYAATSIAALVGLYKLLRIPCVKRAMWIPALSLTLSLCAVHSVYWSNMRMRAPVIPVVSLLAVLSFRPFSRP